MIYYNFWRILFSGKFDWYSVPVYGLLEDSGSNYVPDANHIYLSDLFKYGLIELEDANYRRSEITNKTIKFDQDGQNLKLECFSLNFGRITKDKKAKAVVLYCVIDDQEFVMAYLNNLRGLPFTADGGNILVMLPNGLLEIVVAEP